MDNIFLHRFSFKKSTWAGCNHQTEGHLSSFTFYAQRTLTDANVAPNWTLAVATDKNTCLDYELAADIHAPYSRTIFKTGTRALPSPAVHYFFCSTRLLQYSYVYYVCSA